MFLLQLSSYQPINAHLYMVVMDAEFDNLLIDRPANHTGQIGLECEPTSPLAGRGIDFPTMASKRANAGGVPSPSPPRTGRGLG